MKKERCSLMIHDRPASYCEMTGQECRPGPECADRRAHAGVYRPLFRRGTPGPASLPVIQAHQLDPWDLASGDQP